MKSENIVRNKSFEFAIRIINASSYLKTEKKEYELSRQLIRCGTSIGANIEEGIGAQSKPDFIAKLSIAYKEARECDYWIRLLIRCELFTEQMGTSLRNDLDELLRLLSSILKSAKQ